jgi:putative DNA primase/helicase
VTTSETAENASFDEDLLKRITGRDKVRSRALYQESQEWTPECTIWMATNNPPRLNSDDDAIWRRLKLIPMTTVFRGPNEVFDYARRVLVPEAAGILNWLLAGLRAFQEHGLGEPETLQVQAEEQRTASDSVARFIGDKLSDASLVEGSGTIKATDLFSAYADWCRQVGEKSLGSRRFMLRMDSHMAQFEKTRDNNGVMYFSGLHRPIGSWMVQHGLNS